MREERFHWLLENLFDLVVDGLVGNVRLLALVQPKLHRLTVFASGAQLMKSYCDNIPTELPAIRFQGITSTMQKMCAPFLDRFTESTIHIINHGPEKAHEETCDAQSCSSRPRRRHRTFIRLLDKKIRRPV